MRVQQRPQLVAVMRAPARARVVVVARADLARLGMERLLRDADIEVAGTADDARSALALVQEMMADVVLVDATPHGFPPETVRPLIRAMAPRRVVVVLDAAEDHVALEALAAGARGCVDADAPPDEFVTAILGAAGDERFLSAPIARRLGRRLGLLRARSPNRPPVLTPRERQVLALVARGWDNAQIGRALFVSAATIKHHLANIFAKLGVENRVQAAVRAVSDDLLDLT
jgi:DNA-binding NarL/FixJ family response regulator